MITIECLVDSSPVKARDQGNRPTCLAFAVTDLNRQYVTEDLGPEFFYQATIQRISGWQPGDGLQVPAAADASRLGHPVESDFPYQPDEPAFPLVALPTSLSLHGHPINFFNVDVGQLTRNLQSGIPTGLAVALTREFYQPVDGIIPYSAVVLPTSMIHAVVVVGLGHDSQGAPWFYIRNSWGPAWGQDGHAWISAAYIVAHAACAFGV
ncbi:C1 family peptidase [Pseudomonas luteola]|uniref:C1 family peptidase n=1 Tax=Pseudomonas luteola TaxID=47886 RepID=UPI001639A77D|nr:C1 family peptidase [Pseudomonas luteola]